MQNYTKNIPWPVGLIFGYWFAKTGKLWPPIVAHAAINLLSLLAM